MVDACFVDFWTQYKITCVTIIHIAQIKMHYKFYAHYG